MNNPFERSRWRTLEKEEKNILESLREIEGAEVEADIFSEYHFRIQFQDTESMTSLFVTFFDKQSGADIAITAMTNLPLDENKRASHFWGQGKGSRAVQKVLDWAHKHGYGHIIATQVQGPAKNFWTKNGFVYDERKNNVSEDWIYRGKQ